MANKQVDAKLLISFLSQSQLDITHLSDVLEVLNMFPYRRWFELGLLLGILQPTLAKIEADHRNDVARCLQECMTCWLRRVDKVNERGRPTWDVLASALKKMEENFVAENITQTVKGEMQSAAQILIYPVQMSQLLYSERCISEVILDEVETLEVSVDNKRTTLLSAVCTAVSSDHKNIKVLAKVLSKFEETRELSDKLLNQYTQTFPENLETSISLASAPYNVVTGPSDQISPEQCASDILRYHYATLSQSLHDPIGVSQLLCHEDSSIISEETLMIIEAIGQSEDPERVTVLLKAVRRAVHVSHCNLEMFASILKRFPENVLLANAILSDYKKEFETGLLDVKFSTYRGSAVRSAEISNNSDGLCTTTEVLVPSYMEPTFKWIRKEFAKAVSDISSLIAESLPPTKEVKRLLHRFPELKSELANIENIDDILEVVCDKCTLIDINYLETIVEYFKIEEAKSRIKAYQEIVETFSKQVSVELCLNESFQVSKVPSPLKCETAKFTLDWDPADDYVLKDIKDILAISFKRLAKRVKIVVIKEGNSITVTCIFPLSLLGSLIAAAQETIELVKKRGLIRLSIGPCIIWDIDSRNQEMKSLAMEVKEKQTHFEKLLETQYVITRKKTLEIEDLKAKLKQQEEEGLQLKTQISELKEKQKEIETLKLTIEEKERNVQELFEDRQKDELKLKTKLEVQETTINEKTVEIDDLKSILEDKEVELHLLKQTSEQQQGEIKELKSILQDNEASLRSIVIKKKEDIKSTQETVTSKFKEKEESTGTFEKSSKGDTGSVRWTSYGVTLTSSTVAECKEVMQQLKRQQHTTWRIQLYSLSPQSLLTVLTDINECQVESLYIESTHFDSNCVSQLSQVVTYNKTMEDVDLISSPLLPDTYQLLATAVTNNKTIKGLYLYDDNNITDKDIPYFCHLITNNKTLQYLSFTNCPNINIFGKQQLQNVCVKNNTLSVYIDFIRLR